MKIDCGEKHDPTIIFYVAASTPIATSDSTGEVLSMIVKVLLIESFSLFNQWEVPTMWHGEESIMPGFINRF